jgi:AraC-like DNA-binding protein
MDRNNPLLMEAEAKRFRRSKINVRFLNQMCFMLLTIPTVESWPALFLLLAMILFAVVCLRYFNPHHNIFVVNSSSIGYDLINSNRSGSKKIKFTETEVQHLDDLVEQFIKNEKRFLRHRYSIRDLSTDTRIHPNTLSAYINNYKHLHFCDYINRFRIDYCIELISKGESTQFNIYGLGLTCGFSNRNTFAIAFKKVTSQTPSDYIKSFSITKTKFETVAERVA